MATSPKYFDPQTLARLRGLPLRAKHLVEGYVAGLHRSPLKGFSIEFAEHREYAPGDDPRYLDWKVFGRTDKFYLKQYEDETNLICYVVLDVSESMTYQSKNAAMSKLEYAQAIAATLAHLVVMQQDSVGGAIYDDKLQQSYLPGSSSSHLNQLVTAFDVASDKRKTASGAVLHELASKLHKRGLVVVLSDFFDDVDELLAGLKHLRFKRHDVLLLQILDDAELDFPFDRTTKFEGLEGFPQVVADPIALRRAYLEEFSLFRRKLESAAHQHSLDYFMARTSEPLDQLLTHVLAKRSRMVR